MEENREIDLVRRSQAGDGEAFADLVRTYQRKVVNVAYRLLGNSEDAWDVGQDAFVRAYRNLQQLEDPARFGPWLIRVTSNLSLNFRRSRKLRSASSLEDSIEGVTEYRNPADGALMQNRESHNEELPAEMHDAVTQAIEQLPEKQRLALVLFSVERLPQKEVAKILECSVELVKWNVFQARKKLKELLGPMLEACG